MYLESKTRFENSACTILPAMSRQDTIRGCLSAYATLEVCHEQYTEIVTEQSVRGATSVFVANCCLVRTGRGSANCCLTSKSVLYTKAGASCFVVLC